MAVFWKTKRFKANAEDAYKEIMTLNEITAENVVELARDESSVIHNEFEWDNEVAGEKWREQQARVLIANLVVEVEEPDEKEPVKVRVLHTTPDRHDYKPIEFFVNNVDEHAKLLKMAKAELESFRRKYHSLVELTPIFEAMKQI